MWGKKRFFTRFNRHHTLRDRYFERKLDFTLNYDAQGSLKMKPHHVPLRPSVEEIRLGKEEEEGVYADSEYE